MISMDPRGTIGDGSDSEYLHVSRKLLATVEADKQYAKFCNPGIDAGGHWSVADHSWLIL